MIPKAFLLLVCATVSFAGATDPSKFIRPCHLHTKNTEACVRNNLAANSACQAPRGELRRYRVLSQRFETPHFNASYIDRDLWVTGQDRCFVSEFFFNLAENSGILGIDCPDLNFISDRKLLQHWPLKQDEVYSYKINGTYPLIRLTMYLNDTDKLDICKLSTFPFVAQLPTFHIDPKDRKTDNFLSKDLTLLNIFERETFFYRANLLARKFVNSRLCYFGCN